MSASDSANRNAGNGVPSVAVKPARKTHSAWNWLLVVPVLGLCFPAVYARSEPSLFGWPFFYWYQFAWIILSGVITAVVYFATREP